MRTLIGLEHPAAADPNVAGDKAAGLARAAAASLPVLTGWVVPIAAARAALASGVRRLRESGPPAALLAVFDEPLERALERDLEDLAAHGRRWIVRSSTTLDRDGRWAGTFATYLDVGPELLGAAVRGCWSSVFTADALARAAAAGVDPAALGVGALIQPWRDFDAGGTARVLSDGTVAVLGGSGRPHAVLAGRVDSPVERRVASAVRQLARDVAARSGDTVIEWGALGDEVTLLQARRDVGSPPSDAHAGLPRRSVDALEIALARLVSRFPAPLGDELVVPWAIASTRLPSPEPIAVTDPASAVAEAVTLAGELAAAAWRRSPEAAFAAAGRWVRRLLAGDGGHHQPPATEAVDPADAARLLGLIEGAGACLVRRRLLAHPEQVWRLSRWELDRAISTGSSAPVRRSRTRWEPFVADVVRSVGRAEVGVRGAPGMAAGRLHIVRSALTGATPPPPRAVLAAAYPSPRLAPMLWDAAALVVARGGPAAHVVEVARSLGVPAVLGIDLSEQGPALVTVDGSSGVVSVLTDGPDRARPLAAELVAGDA
jgi:phosphohistidine swiveling domain-containing protein